MREETGGIQVVDERKVPPQMVEQIDKLSGAKIHAGAIALVAD
jgi:predicted regulator of amino acid metabolism with ACT domain